MKQFIFAAFMLTAFSLTANSTNPVIDADTKTVKTDVSTITWTGKKVTGQHTGTIGIKSGSLDFEGGALVGGDFTIDMTSIVCTDLGEGGAKKLEGHLKSDDFFGVANHPTANLKITSVKAGKEAGNYDIMADITIKGITKAISFSANVGEMGATANVTIDRTDFDVRYGSGSFFDNLGDKTIYDDFELVLDLKY
ncbi:MAG: YceI family protein [Saprospiraceae bacterium]|nr:YceI family protein [Saprospiraceae bacterium]